MNYTLREKPLPKYYAKIASHEKNKAVSRSGVLPLDSNTINALHYHDLYEIGICFSGAGQTHINNRIYRHKIGCIEIVPPFHPHLSNSDIEEASHWCWIYFDPQQIMFDAGITDPEINLSLLNDAQNFVGVFSSEEYPVLTKAINDLMTELTNRDCYSELSVAFNIGKLLILLARLSKTEKIYTDKTDCFHDTRYLSILPAIEYIGSNLDCNDSISEPSLASLCNMSVANLRRLFKICIGLSPKAYIIRSRMAYSEYLLRKTDLSVLDISVRVGYGELSGFNRVFVKHFGVSPGKYRKKFK